MPRRFLTRVGSIAIGLLALLAACAPEEPPRVGRESASAPENGTSQERVPERGASSADAAVASAAAGDGARAHGRGDSIDPPRGDPARGRGPGLVDDDPARLRLGARRERAIEAKPEHLLAADLDGDGALDLCAATFAPGTLHVWRGDAPLASAPAADDRGADARSSAAVAPEVVPIGDYPLAPVALAGTHRIALATRGDRKLVVLDLARRGAPESVSSIDLDDVPRAIAAGDLGLDGAYDLVVATDAARLLVVRADGTSVSRELAASLPRCALVLADGSGVAIGSQDAQAIDVYRMTEAGFVEGTPRRIGLDGIPRALCEADLDGDGDVELAIAAGEASVLVYGLGASGGTAAAIAEGAPAPAVLATGSIPLALEAFDAEPTPGDELFVLVHASVGCEAWGTFAKKPRLLWSAYSGQTPCDLALVDLDRDGRRDLVIANRDAQAISTMYSAAIGGWHIATPLRVGKFPSAIAFADLEHDALPEALALDAKEGALSVVGRLAKRWVERERIAVGPSPRALAVGDVDGDGHEDAALLVRDAAGARLVVLSGDGAGKLARRAGELAIGHGGAALVLVPAGVGRPCEIWIADPEASEVVGCVVRRDTDAPETLALVEIARLRVPGGPCALAPLDADEDPELEIAVALGGPGARTGAVILDRGALGLVELLHFAGDRVVGSLAAGDGDGDGRSELALLCQPDGEKESFVEVWTRSGAANGWRIGVVLANGLDLQRIVAGDLDRDGRTDWLVTSQFGHRVDLWLARDGATLAYAHQDGIGAGLAPLDVCVGDLDGDGWPDLGTANSAADEISLIFNLGR